MPRMAWGFASFLACGALLLGSTMVDAAPLMSRFGDDDALALHLLEHGVAIVAASGFGGKDGFRISFAADEAKLDEALRRIAAAVA